jgi:hypothetical protein
VCYSGNAPCMDAPSTAPATTIGMMIASSTRAQAGPRLPVSRQIGGRPCLSNLRPANDGDRCVIVDLAGFSVLVCIPIAAGSMRSPGERTGLAEI